MTSALHPRKEINYQLMLKLDLPKDRLPIRRLQPGSRTQEHNLDPADNLGLVVRVPEVKVLRVKVLESRVLEDRFPEPVVREVSARGQAFVRAPVDRDRVAANDQVQVELVPVKDRLVPVKEQADRVDRRAAAQADRVQRPVDSKALVASPVTRILVAIDKDA